MGLQIILGLMVAADLLWWWWADVRLRRLRPAWPWRILLAGWVVGQAGYILLWLFLPIWTRSVGKPFPLSFHVNVYLWHLLIVPPLCIVMAYSAARRWWRRRRTGARRTGVPSVPSVPRVPPGALPAEQGVEQGLGKHRRDACTTIEETEDTCDATGKSPASPTRRQVLAAAAVAVPPLATMAFTTRAIGQLDEFRVRGVDLFLPALPPDLDGLTIAQVTDLHLGKFTRPGIVRRIIDATNALSADLIVFSGDLIDYSQDDLPAGIDFIRSLRPRHDPRCLVMIEGNHDLLEDALSFEQTVRDAGLPLLLDEATTIRVPGRRTPVQFLGVRWGRAPTPGQTNLERIAMTDAGIATSIDRVQPLRQPDAFPILLSHHPHALDPAAAAGFPLVLAGHTHGGQIMLTDHIGAGPIRFRYWTGLYRKAESQLFISNGVGNWFPLRVNAPMEIVNLTLRRFPVVLKVTHAKAKV